MDRMLHYRWLLEDPEYVTQFMVAKERGADALEDEAIRRAHEGMETDKTRPGPNGEPVVIRQYSDLLMIFLLKGMRPQKYRDNVEVTGAGGGPVTAAIQVIFRD